MKIFQDFSHEDNLSNLDLGRMSAVNSGTIVPSQNGNLDLQCYFSGLYDVCFI